MVRLLRCSRFFMSRQHTLLSSNLGLIEVLCHLPALPWEGLCFHAKVILLCLFEVAVVESVCVFNVQRQKEKERKFDNFLLICKFLWKCD